MIGILTLRSKNLLLKMLRDDMCACTKPENMRCTEIVFDDEVIDEHERIVMHVDAKKNHTQASAHKSQLLCTCAHHAV